MRLKDQVVLITGASRGIGAACAVACAKEGAHLALAAKTVDPHPRLPGTLNEVAAEVRALGREALVLQCDVRDADAVGAMVDQAASHFGRLDALVNNAGAIHIAPVAEFPVKRFDLVMGVNVRAAFAASQAALPHLRKQGGHVLMMSPPVNPKAAAGKAPYLVSKIGMTVVAQALDAEEPDVHACALWPVAAIKTAATVVFGIGDEANWRTPDILSDATVELLARDPRSCEFRAWLDEDVLRELAGQADFARYRCVADSEPAPLSVQLIDPDWVPKA